MITLTVVSHNGQSLDSPLSALFDEMGGTIGRADTNHLVLPDPDRAISRVHAQVVFRNGQFAVVDRGSNPILVNGQAVGNGREQLLKGGDQIQIGGYLLATQTIATGAGAAAIDPFADLLGPVASSPKATASPAWDPLEKAPVPKVSAPSPLATHGGTSGQPPAMGGIPDNWDPFAPDPLPASGTSPGRAMDAHNLGLEVGAAAPAPLIGDFGGKSSSGDSLDDLFGLKNHRGGTDPLAQSALGDAAIHPNMAAHADPMQSLRSLPQASQEALPDDLSDLHRPFQAASAPAARAAIVPSSPPGKPMPSTQSAVLSWDQPPSTDGRTVVQPVGGDWSPKPALGEAPPAVPVAVPAATPTAAVPTAPTAPVADEAALLAALREGLAMPDAPLTQLTPELMRLLGQLLRESASGTVDLLVARAALKREVRAEATMIVARENNPMKFSPSADVALQHLLAPPMRGFMPAVPAMRDAFNDLRAHQFGLVAGMRAALAGVLARFDPAQLEGRLTQRSSLSSLLPGGRKARMWDVFIEHFSQISLEAEDDFHSLFGKAFLQAYNEHIEQLRKDKP